MTSPTIIKRLQQEVAGVEGITLYMQPVQDLTVEDRVSRTQYQFTLEDADRQGTAASGRPKLMDKLKTLPELRDVPPTSRTRRRRRNLVIDRDTASRLGVTTSGHRQHALRRLRPAAGLDHVHAVEPVPRGAGGRSDIPRSIRIRCKNIYVPGTTGQVPLSAIAHFETSFGPLTLNHQGQFPAVTISFNLGADVLAGRCGEGDQQAAAEIGHAAQYSGAFQGTARAFRPRWPTKAG